MDKDEREQTVTPVKTATRVAAQPVETAVTAPTATRDIGNDVVTTVPMTTSSPTATIELTLPPSETPTPIFPQYHGLPLKRDDLGVQIHIHTEDLPQIIEHLNNLGVGWVKVQVSWKLYQPEPDRFDQGRFEELDALIEAARSNEINVLLSVSKAPEWSRPITDQDGPPIDFALYGDFMSVLASRYQGQVAAYELWNEPNLQREWNGVALGGADFTKLVAIGAAGVRENDAQAIIISGAPAVTGINDGIVAVDDRVFLRSMLEAGVSNLVDAIGVHPYGWANPPDSSIEEPAQSVMSHNDHPSFFFRDTLSDYSNLLDEYDMNQQLWATEFGWGSFEGILSKQGTPQPAPENASFMASVSEYQQAEYILRAFEMAQEMEGVGPMILWNLNFGPLLGTQFSETGYSLLRVDGTPRPSYLSLQNAAKN